MDALKEFAHLDVDWELAPDEAVLLYAEEASGEYSFFSSAMPEHAVSRYFVVDTWERVPVVRLLERDFQFLRQLAIFPLPEEFLSAVQKASGQQRGMFAPPEPVLTWLKGCMEKS